MQVGISEVKLEATVEEVILQIGVSYQLPQAVVDYALFLASAQTDESGFNQFVNDAIATQDIALFLLEKAIQETVSLTDSTYVGFGKTLNDTPVASDAISSKGVGKALTDSFTQTDSAAKGFGKGASDSFTQTDSSSFSFGKTLSDYVTMQDALMGIIFEDGEADAVAVDDLGIDDDPQLDVGKLLSDSFSQTDSRVFTFGKSLADGFNQSDALNFDFSKALTESFSPVDALSTDFSKYVYGDSVSNSDSSLFQLDKLVSDFATNTDSGILYMQDYASVDYFAADYVGTSRSF